MEYMYRYFGADGTLLYIGVSDDWTRRARQHWLSKPWALDILSVGLEEYASRPAVLAAERRAIKSERPLYNVQHNRGTSAAEEPASSLTFGDVILIGALLVIAGLVIYEVSQVAIDKYRAWKADREEFHEWRRVRDAEQSEFTEDDSTAPDIAVPTAVNQSSSVPSPPIDQDAFASSAFWANLARAARMSTQSPAAPPGHPDGDAESAQS
jgi:hypothetical protein